MTVEHRSLQQQQRRLWSVRPGNFLIMAKDAAFDRIERGLRLLAVTRHHVESHLHVEDILRQGLEGEQVHGLLVQFVHAALAVLRSRFKNCDD